jgi:hypothetical protein
MISEEFAKEQVRRMGGLNYLPRDNEAALAELIKAAMNAETEFACRRAFDSILHDSDDCPKPADLIRVINVENESVQELRPAVKKCPNCGGTSFVHGTFLVTKHSEQNREGEFSAWSTRELLTTDEQIKQTKLHLKPNQHVLEGSEMCDCHPGRTS